MSILAPRTAKRKKKSRETYEAISGFFSTPTSVHTFQIIKKKNVGINRRRHVHDFSFSSIMRAMPKVLFDMFKNEEKSLMAAQALAWWSSLCPKEFFRPATMCSTQRK